MARLAEANQVITLICLCRARKLTERPNMMYWQALAFIYTALMTLTFLLVNDLLSSLEPTSPAISLFTTSPQWRFFARAMGVIVSAFTFERTKQPFIAAPAQLPRLAFKVRPAVVTYQLKRLYPSRMSTFRILPFLERAFIWLPFSFPKPEFSLFSCLVKLLFPCFSVQTWACLYAVDHLGSGFSVTPEELISTDAPTKHVLLEIAWRLCDWRSAKITRFGNAIYSIIGTTTQGAVFCGALALPVLKLLTANLTRYKHSTLLSVQERMFYYTICMIQTPNTRLI